MQISSLPRYQTTSIGGGLTRRPQKQCEAASCYRLAAWEVWPSPDAEKPKHACNVHVEDMRKEI
jgi:hypothetical protein